MEFPVIYKAPLFDGLTHETVEEILKLIRYKIKTFRRGAVIFHAGDTVSSYIMVLEGAVKGEMTDYAGRVIKIEEVNAPGSVAAAFLFGEKNIFPVNVIALDACRLLFIERRDFLRLLMSHDGILVNFLGMISNRTQFLSEKIKFLNFKTIKGKLAQYIIQKAGTDNEVSLDRTQNDLAEFFGVARPSIARSLGEMESDGLIRATGRYIVILNRKGLEDIINA